MSQQVVIDSPKFTLEQASLQGFLTVESLDRIRDQLAVSTGQLEYELHGSRGGQGQMRFALKVSGELQLVCQRCLEPVPFRVDIDSVLEMLPDGTDVTQDELEDDSKDYLPWEKTLDVLALVEDEVILALPVAARHDKCDLRGRAEAGENVSPFAALASLKSGLN